MVRRLLPLFLVALALGLYLSAPGFAADDQKSNPRAGDTPATTAGHPFEGRITHVDATKHELTLAPRSSTGTGTAPGAGTSGTTDKGAGRQSDRGTSDRPGASSTSGTSGASGQHMFRVTENARITVDGRSAHFADLKAGMFPRVFTTQSDRASSGAASDRTGTSTSGTRDKSGSDRTTGDRGTGDRAGAGGHGTVMTADRIEARTSETGGTGAGTGTDRNRDKDKEKP